MMFARPALAFMTAFAFARLLAGIASGVIPLAPLVCRLALLARLAAFAAAHLQAGIRRAVLPGAPDVQGLAACGLAAFADAGLGARTVGAVVPGTPRMDSDFAFQTVEHSSFQ